MVGYCGEHIRDRFREINSSFKNGFLLDVVLEDLSNLEKGSNRSIEEKDLKQFYQEVLDLSIRNDYTNPEILQALMSLRDGNNIPKETINYMKEVLLGLSMEYLTKTRHVLNARYLYC